MLSFLDFYQCQILIAARALILTVLLVIWLEFTTAKLYFHKKCTAYGKHQQLAKPRLCVSKTQYTHTVLYQRYPRLSWPKMHPWFGWTCWSQWLAVIFLGNLNSLSITTPWLWHAQTSTVRIQWLSTRLQVGHAFISWITTFTFWNM
jgi:hypothetical protein